MAMDEKGLGRRLQAMRVSAGLTQQALCQKAGLSYSTLTKIERGAIKSPSIFTIKSIGEALGVGLDELLETTIGAARPNQKKRSKSGVSFVFFDVNGCLVRFYHQAFTRLAHISGAPGDVVETAFWHYNDEVCRGDISMDEFNRALAKDLGVDKLDWAEHYFATIEPIKAMHELVQWAHEYYKVGLLTNIMPGFVNTMVERDMLPKIQYDAIIDSSEARAIKPEAKIYEAAAQKAGCPPSEILLIDDERVNLMAAEKQGWHVLWFDDYRIEESIDRIKDALEPV